MICAAILRRSWFTFTATEIATAATTATTVTSGNKSTKQEQCLKTNKFLRYNI